MTSSPTGPAPETPSDVPGGRSRPLVWLAVPGEFGRVGAALLLAASALAGGFTWLVSNFARVQPVIEHPMVIYLLAFLWACSCFLLGGAAVYTLIARPMEQRFIRAEAVIRRLRDREREQLIMQGELQAKIAALETAMQYMQRQLDAVMAVRPQG